MSIYQYAYQSITGQEISLSQYEGKVLLIVNTASKCGFTPQYAGLQSLYEKYHDQGFEIIGFPCNQFLHQDPKSNAEIQQFCQVRFHVSFPLSEKVEVKGPKAHPLFQELNKDKVIKWNFTKFLINAQGEVVAHFNSMVKPESLEPEIEKLLPPVTPITE
jgi:glutathione peroxidase